MMKMNARPILSWLTLGLVAIALSGCGGGEQARKFRPTKIVSFGDESSAFTQETVGAGTIKGLKYTVNAMVIGINQAADGTVLTPTTNPIDPSATGLKPLRQQTAWLATGLVDGGTFTWNATYPQNITRVLNVDTLYDTPTAAIKADVTFQYVYGCADNRLWIQILANAYGLSYAADCPLDDRGGATSYAQAGDKVADTITKINSNLNNVDGNTLATVLAGQNDVLAKYETLFSVATVPTEASILAAEADLRGLGQQLGQAVNNLAYRGARVLLSTLPDLSYSPRVQLDADNATTRTDVAVRAAVMKRLIVAYNAGMFSDGGVRNDGHFIAIVKAFEQTRDLSVSLGSVYGRQAACVTTKLQSVDTTQNATLTSTSSDLKYCNSYTLAVAPSVAKLTPEYDYLWAFDTWLSPAGHASLGNLAYQRADGGTF